MQKNILITGAAKRIGATCARFLHNEGCNIFLHYRTSYQEALSLCNELNEIRPDSAKMMQADLLKIDEINQLANAACLAWGGIHVLINNASTFYPTPIDTVTESQWDDLLGSNLKAPFFLTKSLAHTLTDHHGCVVNIIDIHAERGLKGYSAYSIAKTGLLAMTKVLAKDLGPAVRVNGIAPGAILWSDSEECALDKSDILQRIILKRSGNPIDIAKAVLFLIKDSDYITGQVISVDGGRLLSC